MRYNHESYLPIGAFQPILGRMTLHGGGGGGFIGDIIESVSDFVSPVTDAINDYVIQPASDVLAASDDYITQPITAPISQVTSALDDAVIQPVTEPISDVGVAIDDSVNDVIPGGWGTLAQLAAAAATMGQSLAVQAAAAAAAGAGSDFAKNKDIKSAVEQGAIKGATRYGLGTLGEMMSGPTDVLSADDAYMGQAMNKLNSLQPESAVSSLVPDASVQSSPYGAGSVPYNTDVPVYYKGVEMTPAQVAADNPNLYYQGKADAPGVFFNLPNKLVGYNEVDLNQYYDYKPDVAIARQANLDSAYTPSDPMGDLIRQQQLNQSMNSFNEIPDINGVPQRDLSANFDSSKYAPTYSLDKIKELPGAAYDLAKEYVASKSLPELALTAAGAYGLSNLVGGGGNEQQSQAQQEEEKKKIYTYGTAGQSSPNYLLKNRINAGNVYSNATGYRPLTRYAEGGEVQHYGIGGKISDAFTRVAQPFEKAIIRPIGEAAPFLKDLAPYAGMAAGAMMGNPAMAAGIGGIASGFGKPGGFDMKRALMGGIAAYGMSNLAGGLEAAGAETALPPIDSASTVPDYLDAMRTANTPYTAEEAANLIKPPTISRGTGIAPRDMFSLRDTDAMQKGIGNLLQNTNTPAYKDAMAALTNKVGMFSTGLPLIMGTTGVMGVDESNALKQEYDKASAANQAEADKFNARTAAGKKRAQQAVSENPYMFATGGEVNPPDDQTQMASQTPMQNMQQGSPLAGLGQNNGLGLQNIQEMLRSFNPQNMPKPQQLGDESPPVNYPVTTMQDNFLGQGGGSQSFYKQLRGESGSEGIGGGGGGASGAFPLQGQYGIIKMAAGGMPPRFLSGGGDGMSDSIRANIEGSQEARLADGEFVIPADVVSHLGNGSSKAGAKQLYSMMDRVRKARTGNPKQGREIKPTKLMPV